MKQTNEMKQAAFVELMHTMAFSISERQPAKDSSSMSVHGGIPYRLLSMASRKALTGSRRISASVYP